MNLTEEQRRIFSNDGFLILKNFFDKENINKISVWLDELQDKPFSKNQEAMYYEKSLLTNENILVRAENILGDQNLHITKLLISPKTVDCLTQLLGESPILFKDKVNYKNPGSRSDKLHQDQAAGWNAYAGFFITMIIMVDTNGKENAAMHVMKSGNYKKELMGEEWQPLSDDSFTCLPIDGYLMLENNPGDVVFFDSYVPHGSPANMSDRSRRNIFLTFNKQSSGDMRSKYYKDKWKSYPPNSAKCPRTGEAYRV